jgi:putative membrane protein
MKHKLILIVGLMVLLVRPLPVLAESATTPKTEVVYGMLDANGSVQSIQVVNVYTDPYIVDFGDYRSILNLSSNDVITLNGDQLTAQTTTVPLYVQGTLRSLVLPWTIQIRYYLNGSEMTPTQIAGKSGQLMIKLNVQPNPSANPTFAANMALQVGVSIDQNLAKDIASVNATVAQAVAATQLTYTVLPGKSLDTAIEATVTDFRMDAISLNGIRMVMGFDVDPSSLTDRFSELSEAIAALDDGAAQLLSGVKALESGFGKYVAGLGQFEAGLNQLALILDQLDEGALAVSAGLNLLLEQHAALLGGALAIQQATFDAVNANLIGSGLPELTPENYALILEGNEALAPVKAQLDGAIAFTQGLQAYLDGVTQLALGAQGVSDGLHQVNAAQATLAQTATQLYQAAQSLNTALAQLRQGLATYQRGTADFEHETSNLDETIENEIKALIDEISGNGDPIQSFVSTKNTGSSAVQFVLRTSAIELPKADVPEDPAPVKRSFWEKLWDLLTFWMN